MTIFDTTAARKMRSIYKLRDQKSMIKAPVDVDSSLGLIPIPKSPAKRECGDMAKTVNSKQVTVLVDMDCFYVQVEQRRDPSLRNQPCAVLQYQGGSIIAVDYEARKYGVSRLLREDEARRRCPHIQLVRVPERRGKADLTRYREAGAEVIRILSQFSDCIERASIDEAYLDITAKVAERIRGLGPAGVLPSMLPDTHIAGFWLRATTGNSTDGDIDIAPSTEVQQPELEAASEIPQEKEEPEFEEPSSDLESGGFNTDFTDAVESDANTGNPEEASPTVGETLPESEDRQHCRESHLRVWLEGEGRGEEVVLAVGALIAQEMRAAVWKEAGITCSAGVAHNKVLAKLAAGMNKPNQQTVLPMSTVPSVFDLTPIRKIRHLGGKLGQEIGEQFGVENMGQLRTYSLSSLQRVLGEKTAFWLYELCRGIDREPVRVRKLPQSIGCGKNFQGPEKLTTKQQVLHWLEQLADEIVERLTVDQKQNARQAELLTVHFHPEEVGASLSRSCALRSMESSVLVREVWGAMNRGHSGGRSTEPSTPLGWTSGLVNLSLTASKFVSCARARGGATIESFLAPRRTGEPHQSGSEVSSLSEAVDREVFNALPTDIQKEVLACWRDSSVETRKPSTGSSIRQYFHSLPSPSKSTDIPMPAAKKAKSDTASPAKTFENDCTDGTIEDNSLEVCAKCSRCIPLWQLAEHRDYHLALELQREESSSAHSQLSLGGAAPPHSIRRFFLSKKQ